MYLSARHLFLVEILIFQKHILFERYTIKIQKYSTTAAPPQSRKKEARSLFCIQKNGGIADPAVS